MTFQQLSAEFLDRISQMWRYTVIGYQPARIRAKAGWKAADINLGETEPIAAPLVREKQGIESS